MQVVELGVDLLKIAGYSPLLSCDLLSVLLYCLRIQRYSLVLLSHKPQPGDEHAYGREYMADRYSLIDMPASIRLRAHPVTI